MCLCPFLPPASGLVFLSRFAPSSWGQTSCVVKNVSESHPSREATPEACSSQSWLCPCPWLPFITLLVLPGRRLYSGISGCCPLSAFSPFASYNGLLATPTSLCPSFVLMSDGTIRSPLHTFFMALNLSFHNRSQPIAIEFELYLNTINVNFFFFTFGWVRSSKVRVGIM